MPWQHEAAVILRPFTIGSPDGMTLESLNHCDRQTFVQTLGGVFEKSPWVAERAAEMRPFASLDALHAAMVSVVHDAGHDAQKALIQAHPDLAGKAAVDGTLTHASQSEQAGAGLDRLTPAEFEQFTMLNRRYRDRFGMPFIICVRHHDKHTILAAFQQRLERDPVREHAEALTQIAEIARLRLTDIVTGCRCPD